MWAIAGIALNVIGAAFSIKSGRAAAGAAEDAAAEEARLERRVTSERLYQIGRQEDLMAEATIARTAGSGVKVGSQSQLEVMADQAAQFRRERAITQEVGATRAKASLASGAAVAQQSRYQGYTGAATGLSSAFRIAQDKWG